MNGGSRTLAMLLAVALLALLLAVGFMLLGQRQSGRDRFEASTTCVPLGNGDALCTAPGKAVLMERRAIGRHRPDAPDGDARAR